jgi:hypothetical protein
VRLADPMPPRALTEPDRLHSVIMSDTNVRCKTQMAPMDASEAEE